MLGTLGRNRVRTRDAVRTGARTHLARQRHVSACSLARVYGRIVCVWVAYETKDPPLGIFAYTVFATDRRV